MTNKLPVEQLSAGATADVEFLKTAFTKYGHSWKARGGVGMFFNVSRKWDRIEKLCREHGWDVVKAYLADPSETGMIDDIRDLRRYMLLWEVELTKGDKHD